MIRMLSTVAALALLVAAPVAHAAEGANDARQVVSLRGLDLASAGGMSVAHARIGVAARLVCRDATGLGDTAMDDVRACTTAATQAANARLGVIRIEQIATGATTAPATLALRLPVTTLD